MTFDRQKIRNYYEDEYPRRYDSIDKEDLKIKFAMLRPFFEKTAIDGKIVIDLGCGLGGMLKIVADEYKCIPIGTDLSFNTLLRGSVKRFARFQSDSENPAIKNRNIGLLYFVDLLEHLPFPDRFLKELCKLNSDIIMFIPMESALFNNCVYCYRKLIGKDTTLDVYGHIHRFSELKIRRLIADAGFKDYEYKTVLYDNFNKFTSLKGRLLDFFSRLFHKSFPFLHKKLFGGYAFIALCRSPNTHV